MSPSVSRPSSKTRFVSVALIAGALLLTALVGAATGALGDSSSRSGRDVYAAACASCHGNDGRGAPRDRVGFDVPLPDFTDCSFASREPDADWVGVAHGGGPTRGFSRLMPAFGSVLTVAELQRSVDYIREFCGDDAWPRGELNLPRALITEKAYPEDEAVFTATVVSEGPGDGADLIEGEIVYEKRFGARNQVELVVPFGWRDRATTGDMAGTGWGSSVGDVAIGLKRAFWHSYERGSILSATAELILPTGDEEAGFGKGTAVFEPFVSYGQILPAEFFLQGQAGFELPFDSGEADEEAFLRFAAGRSFTVGEWGRTWSPMVEVLGGRELVSGAETEWDIVPQVQVTLNTRQHVMVNVGVRTPLDGADDRETQVIAYLLWDWFDGGLFEGW